MHQTLSVQNNRYTKQTNVLPTGITASFHSYQTIPNYIPSVPVKSQVSTLYGAPYGSQKLANTPVTQSIVNTRKWEDVLTNTSLAQTVLKAPENTVTFREPVSASGGRKLSNKELLAKADLILARSPKKDNFVIGGISTPKETTITQSGIPLYPTKSVQALSSPPPTYLNTFASPVKMNVGLSQPSSVAREITTVASLKGLEQNQHIFLSPPKTTEVIYAGSTDFHKVSSPYHTAQENVKSTAPVLNNYISVLSPGHKEKLDEVVDKIIRRTGASSPSHETYAYKPPIEVQTMSALRPVPVLTTAPRANPYSAQNSAAIRRISDLSEIQRDFIQLKIDSQKTQGIKDVMTPTPFVAGYGYGSNLAKGSGFAAELLDEDENRLESDRESRYEFYSENLPKKEARINRYINPKQQDAPRVFRLEEQSGKSLFTRNAYNRRPQSQGREGEFVQVIQQREVSPEPVSEAFRGVKQTTERDRITSSDYMVERHEDPYFVRSSIAIEEEMQRRNQREKAVAAIVMSEREKGVALSPKSEGVVLSVTQTGRKYDEHGETVRKERINKYSNKVEASVDVRGETVGQGKQPRVMSKTERFFG